MAILRQCCFCRRWATPGLFVALGDQWRCKSGAACERRLRSFRSELRRLPRRPDVPPV